jgi:hypothetical protein
MTGREMTRSQYGMVAGRLSLCAAAVVLALAHAASGQESQPQPQPDNAAPAARTNGLGLLDALGRMVDDSLGTIGLKDTRDAVNELGGRAGETAKDAATTAKDAAETVVRLPATRIVTARQRCAPAANGAPDCQAAANAACRSKGFGSGRSVDIESAQKCPAHVWLSRRAPAEGECALETFVTRAVCQ